jgi:hypothetical protein
MTCPYFYACISNTHVTPDMHKLKSEPYIRDRKSAIRAFEDKCQGFKHCHCKGCRTVSLGLDVTRSGYCGQCSRKSDRDYYLMNKLLPIWYDNGQPQYHVPDCLLQLTHAKKMLVQWVLPFVLLHHLKNGTIGISGHVCAFEQDISSMANILPRLNKDVTVIKVLQEIQTKIGNTAASTSRPFHVRHQNVIDALI